MTDRKIENSELPEDRSSATVLLLGVTRVPTSPVPPRRPCTLPLDQQHHQQQRPSTAQARRSSFSTRRYYGATNQSTAAAINKKTKEKRWLSSEETVDREEQRCNESNITKTTTTTTVITAGGATTLASMDRSVDSIGTCSLDVEASAELSDLSEASSGGTLRSASFKTPSTSDHHLPSYLSLACTVNGYSTTTNYDPERLARSRDASPHRPQNSDGLTPKIQQQQQQQQTYSIQNNLLSPPNLVPLPHYIKPNKMNETQQQHFYSSSSTTATTTGTTGAAMTATTGSKESRISMNLYGKDMVDACYENGHHIKTKLNYESQSYSSTATISVNGQQMKSEVNTSTKSFIQQRVERLYGPGALAHGFLVMKSPKSQQHHQHQQYDNETTTITTTKTNQFYKKFNNDFNESINCNKEMKQSTSSPTLPVLRHLRPEFRAQLPIISPRKGTETITNTTMQKSSTVPTLKDEIKTNGHSNTTTTTTTTKLQQGAVSEGGEITQTSIAEESGEKDGHHFLKVLQNEAERLLKLADNAEEEMTKNDLPEEAVGKIRSASGKARLLVSQKMQQFKGLCTNNITQVEGEAFPTTNEDLQGFWDMVMLQVDQVDALFKEIDEMRANNWQEVKVEKKVNGINGNKAVKKIVTKPARPASAGNEEARKQRELQRKKMIEERRKAMKAQVNKPVESIEIFVPESS